MIGLLYILGMLAYGYYELRTQDDMELGYLTWMFPYFGVGGVTIQIAEISGLPTYAVATISALMFICVFFAMKFLNRDAKRRRGKV
jgi:hypothetical protein